MRVPIARAAVTRRAQGAGRWAFGLVGVAALSLKLYEYGSGVGWDFAKDLFADPIVLHPEQWIRVGILLLEAAATAAVVSVAITYVVVNNTVNNTTNANSTTNNVTTINGQDVQQVVAAIDANLSEIRTRIAAFEQNLVRTEESERRRMMEFLALAESDRNKRQEEQLKADKALLTDIGEALKKIVSAIPPGT